MSKAAIRAALASVGYAIPGGVIGYLILELLYQAIKPGELY